MPSPKSAFAISLDSKENNLTSHPMELEIAIEGQPGPQGPVGPAGPPERKGPRVHPVRRGQRGRQDPREQLEPPGRPVLRARLGRQLPTLVLAPTRVSARSGVGVTCTMGAVWLTAGIIAGAVPAAGQTLLITQNTALFSLLGVTYGGDGKTTFALPDMRSAAPNGLTYVICTQGIFPAIP